MKAVLTLISVLCLGSMAFAEGTSSRGQTTQGSGSYRGDSDITRNIRQQISQDASLSRKAKTVSVETRSGRVILKGSVENATEKSKLDAMARAASGSSTVDNQIVISE